MEVSMKTDPSKDYVNCVASSSWELFVLLRAEIVASPARHLCQPWVQGFNPYTIHNLEYLKSV